MQLAQFFNETQIYREAIKIQILLRVWTSQGNKSFDNKVFVLDSW